MQNKYMYKKNKTIVLISENFICVMLLHLFICFTVQSASLLTYLKAMNVFQIVSILFDQQQQHLRQ